jgi:energy-converting hydrogenase B subunit D
LVLIAVSGFAVVRTQDVTSQIIALGFYGILTGLIFFFFQAPGVALSQITVGAVALPLMVMLAISRTKLTAANRLWFQPAYLHTVYTGTMPDLPTPQYNDLSTGAADARGVIAALLATILGSTSVFSARLPRIFGIGSFLEGPLVLLRAMQSDQINDYVVWMTVGAAAVGMSYLLLLR